MKTLTFSLGNLAECTPTIISPSERDKEKFKVVSKVLGHIFDTLH